MSDKKIIACIGDKDIPLTVVEAKILSDSLRAEVDKLESNESYLVLSVEMASSIYDRILLSVSEEEKKSFYEPNKHKIVEVIRNSLRELSRDTTMMSKIKYIR